MPTALLVEDEPLLRAELRDQLAQLWPELSIVGEAENGIDAIRQIDALRPDVVFLDIQIPGIGGLDVAAHLHPDTQLVFVTAYGEHALRAFDSGANDYLVKPLTTARLALTVKRLKSRAAPSRPAFDTPASEPAAPRYLKWIKASLGDVVRLITVDEVAYFQADGKYTRVITQGPEALIRLSLKQLVEQLDPDHFAQVHRGTIVNLREVDRIARNGAALTLRLRGRPETLAVSEAHARQFRQM